MNHRHRTAVLSLALCIVAHVAAAGGHRAEPATTADLAGTVADLSAPAFSGRLTGSDGNADAADFLAARLDSLGFEPIGRAGSVRLEYEQPVIRQRRPLSVTVTDARGADRRLRAGLEAKLLIRPGISISGHVTGPVLVPDPGVISDAWVAEHSGSVVLVPPERRVLETVLSPTAKLAAVLIAAPAGMSETQRSVFLLEGGYDTEGPMVIELIHSAFEAIQAMSEPTVRIEADYAVESARVANIVGVASDGEGPPILVTAHFDGQGAASSDTLYPGAVDNASGVATAISAATRLSSRTDRPVWVALFNGEEQGFFGSRAFVSSFRTAIAGATVVNIDMVAHSQTVPFSVEANEGSAALAARVADALARRGAPARTGNAGGSDHVSFAGVAEAVSVVQAPYDAMHTTNDVPERFDESVAETLVGALVEALSESPADAAP